MNMLNPEMRALAAFDEETRKLFYNEMDKGNCELLTQLGVWAPVRKDSNQSVGIAYRLIPQCEEWYYIEFEEKSKWHSDSGLYKKCSVGWRSKGGSTVVVSETCKDIVVFRPAIKEEINSVQPEFKLGDVLNCRHLQRATNGLMRIKETEGHDTDYFSLFYGKNNSVIFNDSGRGFTELSKATPEEIKQLEHQEMLHGKKWNSEKENYDDFLTADGLTLKELLEHDLSDIEFYYSDPSTPKWQDTDNTREQFLNCVIRENSLHLYRVKPKSYVDCPITWKITEASLIPPFNDNDRYNLHDFFIGIPCGGYALSGFVYKSDFEDEKGNDFYPVRFYSSGKKIQEKATHARFVKLEV